MVYSLLWQAVMRGSHPKLQLTVGTKLFSLVGFTATIEISATIEI
jgi:hypothetical protein